MRQLPILSFLAISLLLLNSCGSNGQITQDLGRIVGDFQILNLSNGTVESRTIIADLLTNNEYRTTKMVFRAINAGSTTKGSSPSSFGAQVDETQQAISVTRYYMAVFETTRDQWTMIHSSTPWTSFSATFTGASNNELPAIGLSRDLVTSALAAYNGGKSNTLLLPTEDQWEYACRAGSQTVFSWGEDKEETTVQNYAIVSETSSGQSGPRVVGNRQANNFGLFDMHGNVWELTTNDRIRGGSWRDSLPSARSANRSTLDQTTSHPLVGARFILSN
jgi:formylglycine-generating enzyme required for sulfatase activity